MGLPYDGRRGAGRCTPEQPVGVGLGEQADSQRPGQQRPVVADVVVPLRAERIVDGVGEVQREITRDHRQLADPDRQRRCFHQNALYQFAPCTIRALFPS
jgi:hypothetical protein